MKSPGKQDAAGFISGCNAAYQKIVEAIRLVIDNVREIAHI